MSWMTMDDDGRRRRSVTCNANDDDTAHTHISCTHFSAWHIQFMQRMNDAGLLNKIDTHVKQERKIKMKTSSDIRHQTCHVNMIVHLFSQQQSDAPIRIFALATNSICGTNDGLANGDSDGGGDDDDDEDHNEKRSNFQEIFDNIMRSVLLLRHNVLLRFGATHSNPLNLTQEAICQFDLCYCIRRRRHTQAQTMLIQCHLDDYSFHLLQLRGNSQRQRYF